MVRSRHHEGRLIASVLCAALVVSLSNALIVSSSNEAQAQFSPRPSYSTPLTVGGSSARAALPAGDVVNVYNAGANAAYVKLGGSTVTATTSNDVIQSGSCMAFRTQGFSYLAAIETAGATTLNMSGGEGSATCPGGGGGGSGGGGGPVSIADGQDVTGGAVGDAACAAYNTASCTRQQLLRLIAKTMTAPVVLGGVSGGTTPKLLNAITDTGVAVKGGAGQLYMIQCWNPNAAVAYLQVYDAVSITGTPKLSFAIAPTATGGMAVSLVGVQFATGIEVQASTGATTTAAPSTALDCNALYN